MNKHLSRIKSAPELETKNISTIEFPFPFKPYDIQVGFMRELYRTLEDKKIGIFESPTGTGKSLSLICGALTWLNHYEEQQTANLAKLLKDGASRSESTNAESDTKELDWIAEYAAKKRLEESNEKLKEEHDARIKHETRILELRRNTTPALSARNKRKKMATDFDELMKEATPEVRGSIQSDETLKETSDNDEDDNIIVDYDSADECCGNENGDENIDDVNLTKIYFCSRTHSQLAQFVREIKKSPFSEKCRVVCLASRQSMCINEAVTKLQSLSLINDRCLELQKNKKEVQNVCGGKRRRVACKCPFYKRQSLNDFKDKLLVQIQDIEELVSLGKRTQACPYYGTRLAVPSAQLVLLPYNILLHKSTRDACGIKLKDNIIIIDEAHNLLETINSIHSIEVTAAQLCRCHSQLSQYHTKYAARLKAKNSMYIRQLLFVIGSLVKSLGGNPTDDPSAQVMSTTGSRLETVNEFLYTAHLDNINMFKLLKYCDVSQISRKLHGFVEKYRPSLVAQLDRNDPGENSVSGLSRFLQEITAPKTKDDPPKTETDDERQEPAVPSSPLSHIQGFLSALTNADRDGRFVITTRRSLAQCSIKYLLLNPAIHFSDVVSEARSVIVAGGTMQPVSEFTDQLFHSAGVSPQRIHQYSCGHVITAGQLLPLVLPQGPTGVPLDFTYSSRNNPKLIEELGRLLVNVNKVVPGGVVCFFPSYDYEKQVYAKWVDDGTISRLEMKKKFCGEVGGAGQTGAMLLCVVGGKMSEGINFSDQLGRCVVMVGMPYPNIGSPELREKMAYLDANFPRTADGQTAGKVHYENICMKAVNQSIGRAIRHRDDYAAILLLDHRYSRPATIAGLPAWISQYLHTVKAFGQAYSAICKFFNTMKTRPVTHR